MDREGYTRIDSVAEFFDVSVSTVRNWIKQGLIPTDTYYKVGSTYRFNIPAIEAALLQRTEKPQTQRTEPQEEGDAHLQTGFPFSDDGAEYED